jgi:hypothetical protein
MNDDMYLVGKFPVLFLAFPRAVYRSLAMAALQELLALVFFETPTAMAELCRNLMRSRIKVHIQ